MATPIPAPKAEQLVTLADILMTTTDEAADIAASDSDQDIANAKWKLTIADLATWGDISEVGQRLKKLGSLEFADDSREDRNAELLRFRNTVRRRYGLAELPAGTSMTISSGGWF